LTDWRFDHDLAEAIMKRTVAFGYGVACYGVFLFAFLYAIGFLSNLFVPKGIDTDAGAITLTAVLIDFGLVGLFGLQHSIMARPRFKATWIKVIPSSVERSTYVLATSLVLMLLFWQWRAMGAVIWQAEAAWAETLLWAVFAAGWGLVLLSTFVIDHFDLFGLRQVTLNLLGKDYTDPEFKVTFFYKFVRHPLYLGFFFAFWGTPTMTFGHLVFAVGMSAYILIGVRYEERDLLEFLGEDYHKYRDRVPMLIPQPGRVHETVKPGVGRVAPGSRR
jgi:protein-S-isoprenylcysteine O-methyltransferase Ste14